jgi:hypothetical protein
VTISCGMLSLDRNGISRNEESRTNQRSILRAETEGSERKEVSSAGDLRAAVPVTDSIQQNN